MIENKTSLLSCLRHYWHLLLLSLLLGLLFPAPMVALAIATLVSVQVHRKSNQWATPWVSRLFIAGLSLRLFLILTKIGASHFLGQRISIFGDSDFSLLVTMQAKSALAGRFGPENTPLSLGYYGYSLINWIYGAAYHVLGHSPLMLHIFNALFSCLAALLVYLIAIRICSHRPSALLAMGLTLFMPSQILWSVELMKEPVIQCYTALVIYFFVEMITKRKWVYLLPLALMWYPLGHLRKYTHLLMLATLVLAGVFAIPRRLRISLAIITIAGLGLTMKLGPTGIQYYWQSARTAVITSQIGFITTGGAWYKFIPDRFDVKVRTPPMTTAEFAVSLVKAVGYYLLVPFPIKEISLNKLPALPQMVIWYLLLFICFIPGLLYLMRYRFQESVVIIIYLLAFTCAQALMTGNEGTAFRQRDTLTIIYFIPMAVGFFNIRGWFACKLAKMKQASALSQT